MRTIIVLTALMSALCFGQSHKLNPLPKQLQDTIPNFKVLAIDNETELSQNDLKANAKKKSIHNDGDKVSDMVNKYAGSSFPLYFDPNGNLLRKSGFVQENSGKDDYPQVLWGEF